MHQVEFGPPSSYGAPAFPSGHTARDAPSLSLGWVDDDAVNMACGLLADHHMVTALCRSVAEAGWPSSPATSMPHGLLDEWQGSLDQPYLPSYAQGGVLHSTAGASDELMAPHGHEEVAWIVQFYSHRGESDSRFSA